MSKARCPVEQSNLVFCRKGSKGRREGKQELIHISINLATCCPSPGFTNRSVPCLSGRQGALEDWLQLPLPPLLSLSGDGAPDPGLGTSSTFS